jgi:hypothetical protein
MSKARLCESGSLPKYQIRTDAPGHFLRADTINRSCSRDIRRQENSALSRSVSNWAVAASFSAMPSLLLDRSLSSVWMRLLRIPNKTSPIIPIPITASGQIDSFKNVSYGGSHQAIISSAMTDRTTNTPHQMPHFSHEEDAFSRSSSRAFFVPFGRHHAGKNRFSTFLFALLSGALFWAAIFSLWWWLGWLQ